MVGDTASATNVGGSVKTLIWQRSPKPPFTKPLALMTSVTEPSVLVVYFKKFTYHTQHLKMFYMYIFFLF